MGNNLVTNLELCTSTTLAMLNGNLSILYYSHFPTIILSIFFGLFVLLRGEKKLLSRVFFFLSLLFIVWSILDLFTWLSHDTRIIMFTWSLTGLVETLFFVISLYFVYVFVKKEDVALKYKILAGALLLPLIVAIPTKFNLTGFNKDWCYSLESNYSLYYKYFIEIISSGAIILFSLIQIKRAKEEFKKQLIFLLIGVTLFLFSFFSAVVLSGYLVDKGIMQGYGIEGYGLFGTVIFMGFLAYLIVKYKTFNIKLLGTQALVILLVFLIGALLFYVQDTGGRILIAINLLLALFFGWLLVKSVKLEVQRKEELQGMSDKLAEANDQLRKLDNAKSEFISIASHQLRTPLTAIKGFVSLLLEGSYGKLEPRQEDVLNKVYTSNDRLVNLVEDLLNISRIESGRMEFKFAPWQVEDICQEVVDTFVLRAKEHNLYLQYKKPETLLPEIMIDGEKVREVVSNIVDNAIKYTPRGGVTIRVELVTRNQKLVTGNKNLQVNDYKLPVTDAIRVIVSDTGIGVPQAELPYLFTKFSRGKDTSRLNTGGTGLGLYVGRSMIENNGGKIWAESDGEGKGSRFIIELPVMQSQELMQRWG